MLYSYNYAKASCEAVSLRSLSRINRTKTERAAIAAEILDYGLAISDLSTADLAILFGTTASAINKRRAHRGGRRPKPTLADRLLRASPAERLEAARVIGVDIVWDSMIVPALTSGQAAGGCPGQADLGDARPKSDLDDDLRF